MQKTTLNWASVIQSHLVFEAVGWSDVRAALYSPIASRTVQYSTILRLAYGTVPFA